MWGLGAGPLPWSLATESALHGLWHQHHKVLVGLAESQAPPQNLGFSKVPTIHEHAALGRCFQM